MNPSPSVTVGCTILGEFEDDASLQPADPQPAALTFVPPTAAALADARAFWAKVIRRFTEANPEKKGRFRLRAGKIVLDLARGTRCWGQELDVADKQCLVLYRAEGTEEGGGAVRDLVMPTPWTEIVNIHFEIQRPVGAGAGDTP